MDPTPEASGQPAVAAGEVGTPRSYHRPDSPARRLPAVADDAPRLCRDARSADRARQSAVLDHERLGHARHPFPEYRRGDVPHGRRQPATGGAGKGSHPFRHDRLRLRRPGTADDQHHQAHHRPMTVIAASTPPVVAPWDLPGQVAQAINAWLLSVAQSIFAFALHAIADLLTVTPHFERAPEVARLWNLTRGIATGFLVVIALIGGVLLMTSGVAGTRYTVKLIISRLLLAALLANVSLSVFSTAVDLNNALNVTLVAAPLALICYALPQTERLSWAWWRVTAATFLLQPVNALLLGTAGRVFFSSQIGWGLNPVSLLIGPLMAIVLLYLLIRTPWWIYHHMIAPETH